MNDISAPTQEAAPRQDSPLWTVKKTLEWTQGYLESNHIENPRREAQWLLVAATALSRLELYTNYDQPLTKVQLATLRAGIKRRVAGEPLQYILGKAPFRRLELNVRPGVLIPRPETEILVETVIAELSVTDAPLVVGALETDGASSPLPAAAPDTAAADAPNALPAVSLVRVLDLCTGTGCVALSLVYECPGLTVTATDIDPAAVELAHENARELGLDDGRLTILTDDLATTLVADGANRGFFDVVVSNPPYVPTDECDTLPREIAEYEPRRALDGGADGLEIFRRIIGQAKSLLKPGGLLACELHETTLGQAKAFCEGQGFVDARIHHDLADKPRIITARKVTVQTVSCHSEHSVRTLLRSE